VKTYESSTATLRALLAHPSLGRDSMERTFDALADANADARELDEAVRSGMDVGLGMNVSPDEDEIKAELAALEAEARTDACMKENTQQPVQMGATRVGSAFDAAHGPEHTSTQDVNVPDRIPEKVLAE
jgi:charged multivesicular body protein 7